MAENKTNQNDVILVSKLKKKINFNINRVRERARERVFGLERENGLKNGGWGVCNHS